MSGDKITLADDAESICQDAVSRYFQSESRYNHSKIPAIVSSISDLVVQRLTQEAKLPRKYIAHVTILQKAGAGYYAVSSCSWNPPSDSCYVYQAENKVMYCIVTVYGLSL
ncbi:dynein light chain Tctex-type 1 [Angomonas deanei]|uniref:Tctex-1 family, putative n=1 Tax=Angomonas deanei TaxID=59799 RepID=S9V5R1_9TRYP|nr:dynein light chain Tctex-type 1 [Angomonas deanei]EPY41068.1 dynein light chain Tctex-type 1 [Angomonas deanei]EPY42202.1 dynein light chain Tctex-type 1 [Angomonas deanei]EPY42957.1 dynein light chain Tctex-type 1 [Angomonas deanei]CAD2222478.1 Tctex-1 family, putative [Angomonas deanei]|eukprot:EPY38407.1 dynein light chain Tctex-type 1 [Angomonas deanei]